MAECERCGADLPPGALFCSRCGAPVGGRLSHPPTYAPQHRADEILGPRPGPEGERKLVTVLFCDIVGSTRLAERVGPDRMHRLLDRFFELALREVHRYDGTVTQFLGDGFLALFGAPIAYEDHALRAVLAALTTRAAVMERASTLGLDATEPLQLRIGVNTGLVVVGTLGDSLRRDYTAIGDTTNLAARLQQAAAPGEIWLSENTYRAVKDHAECDPLGPRTFKGKAESVTVYRLLHAHPRARRALTRPGAPRLVGRERELAVLLQCLDRLVAGGGGVVGVWGEAGIGKTRLLAEARHRLPLGAVLTLQGTSLSVSEAISYWPFVESLKAWASIGEDDPPSEAWSRLSNALRAACAGEADAVLPYLASVLALEVPHPWRTRVEHLDPDAMGRQVLLSFRRLFEQLAARTPVFLVLEDVHWMDGSSAALVGHLLPLTDQPFLICLTGRPDSGGVVDRLRAAAGRLSGARYTDVVVVPLDPQASRELVRDLLDPGILPAQVADTILAKAGGNPYFIEEVIRVCRDMGALGRHAASDTWQYHTPEALAIPDTVHGLIMARIDRLDDDSKDVLKTAAVVGRSFLYKLVRAVARTRERLDQRLTELAARDFIHEHRVTPELEYVFTHALVQEATYESILLEHRQRLHRLLAETIERLFPDRQEDFLGVLAYHYSRAEDWERAIGYLVKAGDQASRLAADAEALTHYGQAFEACERRFGTSWDPLERATLERKIGEALFRRGDHEGAMGHLERALLTLGSPSLAGSRARMALAIAGAVSVQVVHRLWRPRRSTAPDPGARERIRLYTALGWIEYFQNPSRLLYYSLAALNLAERHGLTVAAAKGRAGLGVICDALGHRWIARRYHHAAMTEAADTGDPIALGYACFGQGLHHHLAGRWDCALDFYRRSAAAYQQGGDLSGWGAVAVTTDWLLFLRGELGRSRLIVEEVIRAGRDAGDRQVLAWGMQDLGILTLCQEAAPEEAIKHIESAIDLFRSVPDHQSTVFGAGWLARCHLALGRIDQALAILEDADRLVALHRVPGINVTPVRTGLAAAALMAVERVGSPAKGRAFSRARHECRRAIRHAGIVPDGRVDAYRLKGTLEWLRGSPSAARKWWQRSLAAARQLGTSYGAGLTHLEIGRRTRSRGDLDVALSLLHEVGARLEGAEAEQALGRLG